MKRVAYIIPGFGESKRKKAYHKISMYFEHKKIKPIIVPIKWKRRTMSDYVQQFFDFYNRLEKHGEEEYIFGFSFGAMIAFIVAEELGFKKVFLCSTSPYFKENLHHIKKSWVRYIGQKRIEEFKRLSINDATKVKSKTLLFVGSKEGEIMEETSRKIKMKIKGSRLIVVRGANHNLNDKEYLQELKREISKIK